MMSVLHNSHRKPLREANTNLPESSIKPKGRDWWSLKGFSLHRYSESPKNTEATAIPSPSSCFVGIETKPTSSVSSILTQVCGGSLRSIRVLEVAARRSVLLEFVNEEHADIFRDYVKSKRCLVNGMPVMLTAPANYDERVFHEATRCEKLDAISRRTLEIYRPVHLQFQRACLIKSDVEPLRLKKIFSEFGTVLQVRPMVYRKHIAFAIDYADIDSALRAKETFDSYNTKRRNTEACEDTRFDILHGWSLDFSRDSAERSCCF